MMTPWLEADFVSGTVNFIKLSMYAAWYAEDKPPPVIYSLLTTSSLETTWKNTMENSHWSEDRDIAFFFKKRGWSKKKYIPCREMAKSLTIYCNCYTKINLKLNPFGMMFYEFVSCAPRPIALVLWTPISQRSCSGLTEASSDNIKEREFFSPRDSRDDQDNALDFILHHKDHPCKRFSIILLLLFLWYS